MTKSRKVLVLETSGQPKRILERMRPAFQEHVRPHTKGHEGERLGGSGILQSLWKHRTTQDIDAYVHLASTESGKTILDRAAASCGAHRIEHATFKRLEFKGNGNDHINVTFGTPTPKTGEAEVILDGKHATILNTAQIMSGKLNGRGMTAPVRDLYDIAVCRLADPEALETAVNSVPDEKLNAILTIYRSLEHEYRGDAVDIENVPEALQPIRADPTGYARNAILESRYTRVGIRTENGRVSIETETHQDNRTVAYDDPDTLLDAMERRGFNAFFNAQERSAETIGQIVLDRMQNSATELVIEIRPEVLKHKTVDTTPLKWKPPTPRIRTDEQKFTSRNSEAEPRDAGTTQRSIPPATNPSTREDPFESLNPSTTPNPSRQRLSPTGFASR